MSQTAPMQLRRLGPDPSDDSGPRIDVFYLGYHRQHIPSGAPAARTHSLKPPSLPMRRLHQRTRPPRRPSVTSSCRRARPAAGVQGGEEAAEQAQGSRPPQQAHPAVPAAVDRGACDSAALRAVDAGQLRSNTQDDIILRWHRLSEIAFFGNILNYFVFHVVNPAGPGDYFCFVMDCITRENVRWWCCAVLGSCNTGIQHRAHLCSQLRAAADCAHPARACCTVWLACRDGAQVAGGDIWRGARVHDLGGLDAGRRRHCH